MSLHRRRTAFPYRTIHPKQDVATEHGVVVVEVLGEEDALHIDLDLRARE
jgi:hypothetical protein